MGYKLFSSGEVLTAANVNNYLMNQTVMVFADSTARSTALSGVLAAGMVSYLTGTQSLETYNGTTWVSANTTSKTLLSTTTLSGTSTTISSISSAYQDLEIYVYGVNLSANGYVTIQPNGTANICNYIDTYKTGTTGSVGGKLTDLYLTMSGDDIKSATTNNSWLIRINGYNQISTYIPFSIVKEYDGVTYTDDIAFGAGVFKTGAAISSLKFASNATMNAGTVKIYGVK